MKLESMTLNNFRQFGGTQTIEFATDDKKNVTFILAGNGVGKTTLLKAFIWCLYGTNGFDQNDNQQIAQLVHLPATDNLSQGDTIEASVEIKFTDSNIEYDIIRTAFYRKDANNVVTDKQDELTLRKKDTDGNSHYIDDDIEQKRTIDKILPERLAKFFFFEGENIGNMGISLGKDNTISEAIKGLLGLGYLENTRLHLKDEKKDNVIKRLSRNFTNANAQLNVINDQIKKLDDAISQAEDEIARLQKEINAETVLIDKKNEQITSHMPTQALGQKRDAANKRLKELQDDCNSKIKELRTRFNNEAYLFLLRSLIKDATEDLNGRQDLDAGIPDLTAPTVQHILETGDCICGTHIAEEHVKKLTKLLKSIPPEAIGTTISKFKNACKTCLERTQDFDIYVNDKIASIADNNAEQRNTEDDLKYIEQQLAEAGYVDITTLLREVQEYVSARTRHESQKKEIEEKRDINKNEKNRLEEERTTVAASNAQDAIVNLRIQYAEQIYDQITQLYKEREQEIRQELANLMMKKFELFHGTRYEIKLDEDYSLLFTQNGKPVVMSGGQGVCIVFALVTSVIELRKKYVTERDDSNINQNIEYPFVMDASISVLDKASIKSVCCNLPHMADQIIFMCKDTDGIQARDYFKSYIGEYYELEHKPSDPLYTKIERK